MEMVMEFVNKPLANTRTTALSADWVALSAPLREYGEIAGQRLSSELSEALRQAEQQLFSASLQALTRTDSEALLDAAEFSRSRKNTLIKDFLKHFEQRYARACLYKPAALSGYRIDFDASKLEIIEHDLLDDSLEPGQLADAIHNSCWNTLNELTQGFSKLLGAASLKPIDMPLNPKLIEAALSEALRAQMGRHAAKLRLMTSLKRFLPERINRLFHDLAVLIQTQDRQQDMAEVALETPADAYDCRLPVMPSLDLPTHNIARTEERVLAKDPFELAPQLKPKLNAQTRVEAVSPLHATPPHATPPINPPVARPISPQTPPQTPPQAPQPTPSVKVELKVEASPAVQLNALEIGVWLEYQSADGVLTDLKVAWISPRKSLYLMTNRKGERALSMLAKDLAAALADGRARVVLPREKNTPPQFVAGSQTKKTA
jgi:hypothetical protein